MVRKYRKSGRKPGARRPYRGRKSVGRRRQPARVAKRGLPKRQTMQSSLGGLTLTRFTAARRAMGVAKHIKTVGQTNFINVTYPGITQADAGRQGYSAWYLNAGNDLRRIWASIQSLYTAKNATTSAEFVTDSTGVNAVNASFRYVLESAISQLNIANTCGTPVNLELYDIVAKRDSGQLPTGFKGALLPGGGKFAQGTLLMDPATAWNAGMINEATNATGFEADALTFDVNANATNLGSTPYQSKLFKDYFKVVRKTNVSLPIGGQHKHFVDLKPNVIIDNDMLQQNNVLKGVSFFTLVVVSGIPVVKCADSDTSHPLAQPLGDTTTSAVSVSLIQQVRYKWSWVEDSRENIYRANYINWQNTAGAQTTQPAMVKVKNADTQLEFGNGDYLYQPSECTL